MNFDIFFFVTIFYCNFNKLKFIKIINGTQHDKNKIIT